MTMSHTMLLSLIGKAVAFNYTVFNHLDTIKGVVQGIAFDISGSITLFVENQSYSFSCLQDFEIL